MITLVILGSYLLGSVLSWSIAFYLTGNQMLAVMYGLSVGGVLGVIAGVGYWLLRVPLAVKDVLKAYHDGILIVAIGQDKKMRLLPGRSDGFVIRPTIKPYKDKYAWAADGESAYPVEVGKGMQGVIAYMGYPHPLAADMAAAITRFTEAGFTNPEDLKLATELPEPEAVLQRIRELEELLEEVKGKEGEEVEREFGAPKEEVLAEIAGRLNRYRKLLELVKKHGGGPNLAARVDGTLIRARDLINYLVWRHHPAELERIIKAETNAIISKMKRWDWLKPYIFAVIVGAMAIIGILAAIHMLGSGTPPSPPPTVTIGGG